MPKRSGVLVLLLLLTGAAARADELRLKDGRVLHGKVLERSGGRIVFLRPEGQSIHREADVLEVVPGRSIFDEYADRAANVAADDVEGRLELGLWCHAHGLRREMRIELERVVALAPDHEIAHQFLGHLRVGDRWLPREQALRKLGWVKRGGRWCSPEEEAERRREEQERRELTRLERRANVLVERMIEGPERRAADAHRELVDLARREKIDDLERIAGELHEQVRRARALGSGHAVLELRLQQAQLLSRNPRSLSLGTGSPVTVELPEVRSTRVATTVGVPTR